MSFKSLLNATCKIQRNTKSQSATSGEITNTWNTIYPSVKCRLDEARSNSGEITKETAQYTKATHVVFMEKSSYLSFTEKDRIIIDDNNYQILIIIDAGGAGLYNQVMVKRVF
ncbi:phage head closure protein [Patescibacteria group bacterium]|nr:phage head closure protein [Patescibacteria group bacterium]